MGTGVTGSQHTEDQAEGDTVKGAADDVVVSQDEQAKDTYIHQEGGIAVLGREADTLTGVLHQLPVVTEFAAH